MGNGGSKPEQHVFNAEAPVRFSQNVVDSLQNSPDTDSTRAQDTELKIQTRVNSELKRLRDESSKNLSDRIANPSSTSSDSPSVGEVLRDPNTLFSHLSSPFYHTNSNDTPSADSDGKKGDGDRTHDSVQAEIEGLKKKLEGRKKVESPGPEVERAKEKLVKCLRTNDRRPLDCWAEVELFRSEVGKLERAFVERAGR